MSTIFDHGRSAVLDPARLEALRRLSVPGADHEAFDRLARLAARYLGVPVVLVSLVEADRQVVAGAVGLPEPFASERAVPPFYSYCHHVVERREPLVVPDAREHPLFREHPALLEFGVVAYLGIPILTAEGHVLGSFCAIDARPHPWSEEQIGFLEDLTASVMTEIELRNEVLERTEADARATRILESITDGFFAVDTDWRLTYVNREAETLLRRPRAELLGSRFWDSFPEACGTTFEQQYRRAREEGATVTFEAFYPPLDSWYAVHAYPSADGLSVYFHGINERKQAEARQAASEAHYRRLATNVPLAVYVLDSRGRFTELNAAAERILARTTEELLGESFATVVSPETLPHVEAVFQRIMAGQTDHEKCEARIRHPSGEERLIAITATAVQDQGRITGLHGIARDITEERAAERALRESEERFREIAANVRDAFWICTPDLSEVLYMSPAYERISGQPVERILADGRAFLDVIHPDDVPDLLFAMERAAHEPIAGVACRMIRPDASVRWVLVRSYPVRNQAGDVTRIVGTTVDITDHRLVEEQLRESEAQFRLLVEHSPDVITRFDLALRHLYVSPSIERAGLSPEVFLGKTHLEVAAEHGLPEEFAHGATAALTRVRDSGRQEVIDFSVPGPSGVQHWQGTFAPILDEAGAVEGLLSIARDVTQLAEAQEALRESEERFRQFARNIDAVFWLYDVVERRTVYCNFAYERIWGIPRESIFKGDGAWLDLVHPEDRARVIEATTGARRDGYSIEYRISRPDGEERWIWDRAWPVRDGEGGVSYTAGISTDITERKQTEVALREMERQRRHAERLASLGTLVGGVAHELNNPLHAILNFAQLLLLDERSHDDREALEIVAREADRMAKIVSDLKQVARSTQEETADRHEVDLNEVVRHVLRVQEYRLRTANVEVREDLAADLPKVLADRGQLEQVVLNLVVNAEQAMTTHMAGGQLIVRTRPTAKGAALYVIDNGPGIPARHRAHIFDPFFTTKAPGEGTGLGLSLVQSIVAEHGGQIHLDSEVGTGTAFRIDWLRAPEKTSSDERAPAESEPKSALRVLIVDDEAAGRMVTARYLRRRGHLVDEAGDGAAALAMVERTPYDVIVSDLRMPGLDGESMMRRLGGHGLAKRVIFVTGDAAGAGARLSETGAPILLKPARLEEVARLVEEVGWPPV